LTPGRGGNRHLELGSMGLSDFCSEILNKSQNGITRFGIYHFRMVKSLHTPEYGFFCSLLVKAREDAGLTQADVAAQLGRPQSFVAKYERGERRLDVVEFVEVSDALKADAGAILVKVQTRVRG